MFLVTCVILWKLSAGIKGLLIKVCACKAAYKCLRCIVGNVGFIVWNKKDDISGSAVSTLIIYFQDVHNESNIVTEVHCRPVDCLSCITHNAT